MKINLLDSLIYNRIAAGEVVEKPASVVKELVENSIDAGSAEITISIQNGGIDNITITDNGCGIDVSDIKNAFLPHATSKISKIADLDSICTLGFRGEALPSIASVSKITVKSKTLNSEIGCKLTVIGGICGEVENCACNEGTVFEINNLFYNTPARAKFLKKAKTEENNISQVVTQLILANPDVAFKYIVEGKTIYKTIGNGLENIIYDIYQPNIAKNLLQVSFENNGYKIFGYVSNNNLTKPNKSYQTTIVNGRFIVNNTISTAVTQAYGNNLMKRCYPVYVLNLIIPFDDLDVNVTPNKSDVRFIDSQIIFSLVYRAVKDALLKNSVVYNEMTSESSKNTNNLQHNNESSKNSNVLQDNNESSKNSNVLQDNNTNTLTNDSNSVLNKVDNYNNTPNLELNNGNNQKNTSFIPQVKGSSVADKLFVDFSNNAKPLTNVEDFEYFEKTDKSLLNNKNKSNCNVKFENDNNINIGNKNNNNDNKNNYIVTNENCNANNSEICNAKNEIYGENNINNNENLNNGVNLKQNTFEEDIFATAENYLNKPTFAVLGQLFDTYLLCEADNCLYIIDQHAYHERILYDNLIEKIQNKNILQQPLLIPYIINVNYLEKNIFDILMQPLNEIGFEIEEFGNLTYKINALPLDLCNLDIDKFINNLILDKNQYISIKITDILKEKLAQTACKHAIKGGDKLNEYQINSLINLAKSDKIHLQCPHGRPTIIKIEKKDVDKMFKRIL